jgi:dipeptidase D
MSRAAFTDLEPTRVWKHFLDLTRIARPSREEEAARAHVLEWATLRGFGSTVDEAGNVVVRAPASPGRDLAPTVVLQSHLDMVCERDPDSPNDPREGRLEVVLREGWVVAEGTTLGADNGIGVAAAMAAADDPELSHGPLELLFTVSEEQGLEGAKALDPALVSGRLLLNLDGSEEGITVGGAGSIHTFVRRHLDVEVPRGQGLEVRIFGARGGHSGEDIADGRANANKVLGAVLAGVHEQAPFRLASLEGGVSRNAIPREARAVVSVSEGTLDDFRAAADASFERARRDVQQVDPELSLELGPGSLRSAADDSSTAACVHLLAEIPTGVIARRADRPNAVETSTSLTVVQTEESVVTFASMTRSSNSVALDVVVSEIRAFAERAGAEIDVVHAYPPWEPDLESQLLARARGTWDRLFGAEPELTVVHGGLECAVLGEKVPGIEMISIGPEIQGPHAPGERLSVSSTQSFYRLLGALLDDLSR